jgi:Flp pilus assembly pilin Flp
VFNAIQFKILDALFGLRERIKEERGQTATEYTLMVAVGAALAIGVVWALLEGVLTDAITAISDEIDAFITDIFS